MDIHFDLRWYYGNDRSEEMTAELFRLLHAIQENGSLRAAAAECAVSYRHAWGLLQKWQELTGHPLVLLERGKGAILTLLGEKLIREQKRIVAALEPNFSSLASELATELNALVKTESQTALHICASHGLAVAMLRELAKTRFRLALDLQFHGSLDSLQLLKSGRCDMAGFHLPEGTAGARFLPRIRRFLNPGTDRLVYAVRRRQGLMTAAGNPYAIQNLSDLARKPVRFINRQKNSGTRTTFDFLIEDAGIDPDRIQGYHTEEFTHLAVAALVASGASDCAFGIEEAARQFNLNFIPFNWETYWFVVANDKLRLPSVAAFLSLLRSPEFQEKVAELSGHEALRAGTLVRPDADLQALLM
ncbi:MAG: LysR family transcriptional regulator [Methylococcaceae bacterium]|nr:LysR family transcriptional regulator [Methylococcaceae bacterium]MCI0734360.1 LysR family transcriptional regulator [Methylococcaceae bacterium]